MDIRIGYFIKSPIVSEIYSALKSNVLYEVTGITAQHVTIESGEGYRTILAKSKLAEQRWEVVKPFEDKFKKIRIDSWIDTGNLYEFYHGVTKGKLYQVESLIYSDNFSVEGFNFLNDSNNRIAASKAMWDKYGFNIKEKQEPQVATEEPTYQEMKPLGHIEYLSIIALAIDLSDEELQDYYKRKLRELEGAK